MTIQKTHEQLIKEAHELSLREGEIGKNNPHRLAFHLDPPSNWMNDPNGLVYFNEEYHVFYQFTPDQPETGLKFWGHFRSKDLINWELLPPAIAPGEEYDLDGCWSGSAVANNDELTLIYTGHVDNKSPKEVQCIATSTDGVHFTKHQANPVVAGPPPGFSEDFRDPKVWKHDNSWYMVVGNGLNGNGQVLLYQSSNLVNWTYLGVMAEGDGTQGFMWECPDLINLGEKDVLILSPEGMDNIKHKSIYKVGNMNYETNKFEDEQLAMIDYGSDFYAPQTLKDGKGRTIMFGWMNLWESSMPTRKDRFVGSLTIPRELRLNDENKLIQIPVEELKQLRKNNKHYDLKVNEEMILDEEVEVGEIEATFTISCESKRFGLKVRCSEDEETIVGIDVERNVLFIDRKKSGEGDTSMMEAPITINNIQVSLRLFVDRSSLEVFANGGETVVTTRIYPKQTSQNVKLFSENEIDLDLNIYELEDKMTNKKVIL